MLDFVVFDTEKCFTKNAATTISYLSWCFEDEDNYISGNFLKTWSNSTNAQQWLEIWVSRDVARTHHKHLRLRALNFSITKNFYLSAIPTSISCQLSLRLRCLRMSELCFLWWQRLHEMNKPYLKELSPNFNFNRERI